MNVHSVTQASIKTIHQPSARPENRGLSPLEVQCIMTRKEQVGVKQVEGRHFKSATCSRSRGQFILK